MNNEIEEKIDIFEGFKVNVCENFQGYLKVFKDDLMKFLEEYLEKAIYGHRVNDAFVIDKIAHLICSIEQSQSFIKYRINLFEKEVTELKSGLEEDE